MRFTLGTDASTLTHPVQLCLVAIPMIVPSTYRKCIYSLSSKTVTSGYNSLTPPGDQTSSITLHVYQHECFPINIGDHQHTHHYWLVYRLSLLVQLHVDFILFYYLLTVHLLARGITLYMNFSTIHILELNLFIESDFLIFFGIFL